MRVSDEWSGSRSCPKAGEPADGKVDLRFAHQPTIMHDPEQKARKHQAERCLGIYPRPADIRGIELGHLPAQPAEIENPVDAGENVVVGHEVSERSADEELELSSLLRTQHLPFPAARLQAMESAVPDFFNGPT